MAGRKPRVGNQALVLFPLLLELRGLLPLPDKEFSKRSGLSRKQVYLLYLLRHAEALDLQKFQDLAYYLHITNSTLTRNLDQLEVQKMLQRTERNPAAYSLPLRLTSKGQLYALEIENAFAEYFQNFDCLAEIKRLIERRVNHRQS